ncbi:MAG: Monoamine oxidase regulatory protein, putative [Archaeoglobus fulgidus]|uniref:Monoamine oxidase regulatory protein, putative n=2 Tax=Archaeoglobus fulgidus TaxID=2234 RepID=A0A117KLF8_ARCFL|nr:MaoC/PaaZ C-terminal domain-containing protein [Archaeoglobus fulgidus]KUJ92671.1 MAG: Monoamine oxidase regulatory protein, putative [Archaeoglobus fulgidus]
MIQSLYFEDFQEGMELETVGRTVTEADIVMFAALTGDWNPIHVDAEYAKTTIFGQRIAHGTLTFSIMTGLLMRLGFLEETVVAFYGVDRLRFTNPVFIGDTIKARAKVVEKQDRGQFGVVKIEASVVKQTGDVVLNCILRVAVKKKG